MQLRLIADFDGIKSAAILSFILPNTSKPTVTFIPHVLGLDKIDVYITAEIIEEHNANLFLIKSFGWKFIKLLLKHGVCTWRIFESTVLNPRPDIRLKSGTKIWVREIKQDGAYLRKLPYNGNRYIEVKLTRKSFDSYQVEVITETARQELIKKGIINVPIFITHTELMTHFVRFN